MAPIAAISLAVPFRLAVAVPDASGHVSVLGRSGTRALGFSCDLAICVVLALLGLTNRRADGCLGRDPERSEYSQHTIAVTREWPVRAHLAVIVIPVALHAAVVRARGKRR